MIILASFAASPSGPVTRVPNSDPDLDSLIIPSGGVSGLR